MTDGKMGHSTWPFSRQDPTRIVLPAKAGVTPSALPPVRIFLGTEEAQYRAERIFFYSVEKFRDPARVYEIYLMKNVDGFDRRKWRTGFTNYRYAIPAFAGGEGRAIYNDVDQIYLADPALLFDTDMGDHGYLAISAKDTSVMVMDCTRMLSMWNRETAAKLGKHELINKPSSTPGLWGELDGHWNARDQEYIEGRTMCLHYTALHQQPWEPFPDDYSYHPNPLAYIWHDLEREADLAGYQLFEKNRPSPDFAPVTAAAGGEGSGLLPSAVATRAFKAHDIRDALILHTPHGFDDAKLPPQTDKSRLAVHGGTDWPSKAADAVIVNDLLWQIPPADLPWVLDACFGAARRLVYVQMGRTAPEGMGSALWWERRLTEVALRHPGVDWQMDAKDLSADLPDTVTSILSWQKSADRVAVWTIASGDACLDRGIADVLERMSVDVRAFVRYADWPNELPAMIVVADPESAARALSFKTRNPQIRLVEFGHHGLPPSAFDLVVSTPDERVPIRDHVLHLPVLPMLSDRAEPGGPLLAVSVPSNGHRLDTAKIAEVMGTSGDEIRLWFDPRLDEETRNRLLSAGRSVDVSEQPLEPLIAGAERFLALPDQKRAMAIAAQAGVAIEIVPQPYWHDIVPGAKALLNVATLVAGGGTSYRGTPHQQHFIARSIDKRVIESGWRLPTDLTRLHRALIGRGLARWYGQQSIVAAPKPLDINDRIIERLNRLLAEDRDRQSVRAA